MVLHYSNSLAVKPLLEKAKYFVIAFWLAAGFGCIYPFGLLNGALDQNMSPPRNSQAASAKALFASKFGQAASRSQLP